MRKAIVVGNLGADAVVKKSNGREFVSFRVADSRLWTDNNGGKHEETTWCSCILNGNGGALLKYLTKGAKVIVIGRESNNLYSSPKEKKLIAGIEISVDSIELLGGRSDSFPRRLASSDGVLLDVFTAHYIDLEKAKQLKEKILYTEHGDAYEVVNECWLQPLVQQPADAEATEAQNETK